MGGNALKATIVGRLTKSNYERVARIVKAGLLEEVPGARAEPIEAYRAKADFGDLDILISKDELTAAGGVELLKAAAVNRFNAKQYLRNGPVLSFDYRESADQTTPGFQVDVIMQDSASFEYGLKYFSFNDLGNLIGRTAHKMGVAHRHDGLFWYYRDGTYLFQEICLTLEHTKALEFLGYDPERYAQGFEGLEDIYRYVSGAQFFNRDVFLLENRNHVGRTRDRKRKTYTGFLAWCAERPDLPAYNYPEDKKAWFPRLAEYFPHFPQEFARVERDLLEARSVKGLFNGQLVSRITGYSGKRLGSLMARMRHSFGSSEALRAFMVTQSTESIEEFIKLAQISFESSVDSHSSQNL